MSSSVRQATSTAMASENDVVSVVVGRFDPLMHRGLAEALGEDRRVRILAAELGDLELERAVARRAPRVVVLGEAVEHALLQRLKASRPALGVLVLADTPTRLYGTTLLAAGVTCLTRSAATADILTAIHLTARGELTFVSADHRRVERHHPDALLLTDREIEVFGHLSSGKSYVEAAHAMGIAEATVRTHSDSIRRKLGVKTKRELIGMTIPGSFGSGTA